MDCPPESNPTAIGDLTLKYHDDFGFANFAPERIEGDSWDAHNNFLCKALADWRTVWGEPSFRLRDGR